jgi:hypothetical protein
MSAKLGFGSRIRCNTEYTRWKKADAQLTAATSKDAGLQYDLMQLQFDITEAEAAVKRALGEAMELPEAQSGGGMFDCKKSFAAAEYVAGMLRDKLAAIADKTAAKEAGDAKLKKLRADLGMLSSPPLKSAFKSNPGNKDKDVSWAQYENRSDWDPLAPVRLANEETGRAKNFTKDDIKNRAKLREMVAEKDAKDLKDYQDSKAYIRGVIKDTAEGYSVIGDATEGDESALIPAVHDQPLEFSDDLFVTYYDDSKNNFAHMAVPNGSKGEKVRVNRTNLSLLPYSGIPSDFEVGDLIVPALGGAKKRAAKKPAAKKAAAKKPAAKKPAAKKPAAKKPATKKPAAKKPAAKK